MNIQEFINKDSYAAMLGIELLEATSGYAKAKLEIKDEHINAVGIAHGGAIFSLADLTQAAAANSHGEVAIAINVSISFLKAAGKEILYAEAIETSRSNKIASYIVNITNKQGELVACSHGMVYLKKETY